MLSMRHVRRRSRVGALLGAAASAMVIVPFMAGTASAADLPSSVSATVYNHDLEVFYTGRDAGLWETTFSRRSGWRRAREIPGSAGLVMYGPAADTRPDNGVNDIDVFYGINNGSLGAGLGQRVFKAPPGWAVLPATNSIPGTLTSAPAVTVDPDGPTLEVFYLGPGNTPGASQLVHQSFSPANGWSGEISLGGQLTSAPAASVYGAQVEVFARGVDGGLEQTTWTPGEGWSTWTEIARTNGGLSSAPAALVAPNGDLDVIYAGTNDGELWNEQYSPTTGWQAPVPIAGTSGNVGSAPTAVSYRGKIDVFYLAADGSGLRKVSSRNGVKWTRPVVPARTKSAKTSARAGARATSNTAKSSDKQRRLPKVKADLNIRWKWNGHGTRVSRIKAVKFPPTARITVSCSGRRCPVAMSAGSRNLGGLWNNLEHHWFHRNDQVTFTITQSRHSDESAVFRIRHGASPVLEQAAS